MNMTGLIIYLTIGLIFGIVTVICNWNLVTKMRNKVHENYIKINEEYENNKQYIHPILYTPMVFDVRPWAEDYVPIIIAGILMVGFYPIELIAIIVRRRLTYDTKYTSMGMDISLKR